MKKNIILEIDNFKDELNIVDKQNKIVKLNNEIKSKIFDLIDDYSLNNYLNAKEIYQKEINYYKTNLITEKSSIENKLCDAKENLSLLNKELQVLKEKEELEYMCDDDVLEAEEILQQRQVPFIQLYKVIEFKNLISDVERNKLEDLLISMNILNAKIVPQKYFNKINNIKSVFLKEGKMKKNNLLSYFDVLENDVVPKNEIEKILSSISVSQEDNVYINSDSYNLDFLVGYPSTSYQSKYIGIIKRKQEHQRQIFNKEKEIELKMKIIQNYENILNELKNKLIDVDESLHKFPNNNELEKINLAICNTSVSIDLILEKEKFTIDEANKISNDIRTKIEEINQIKDNIMIPLNLFSYKKSLVLTDEILKNINNMKNLCEIQNTYNEQKISFYNSLEDIKEEIDYQNEELSLKTKLLNEFLSKKKAIDEILSNPDYQKQLEKLKYLTTRKNEIPKENNNFREEKGKLENSVETLTESLIQQKKDLEILEIKLELSKKILDKEYNLHYVFEDDEVNASKILQNLKSRENSSITKSLENYLGAFNDYKQELLDYRLITKEIFANNMEIFKEYLEKGLDEKSINQILSTMGRQDLETTYQGKKLNVYELSNCLKEAVIESENYINEQERHLFEDILLKTVGNKIRNHIDSSKEWVKKINDIMRSTQIDSNLSFELEWKSKVAFTEDELDTKELVRLFKIDAGQLEHKDSEKLITHFRSQIKKELEFNEKVNDSYSNIIFKVLDYRNWFEFKLYYKRKSGERKELTNKVFSVLSGGERAKSMYVPLFASVYAKLLNARENALRLIALDEAFAGVDNSNIREMFDILAQLNLDYILTSQSLWGDYDTVNELSICELIKDEINKTVAVRHYRWNGHSKEIVEKRDLYV